MQKLAERPNTTSCVLCHCGPSAFSLRLQMALLVVPERAEAMTLQVVVFGHPELSVTHSDP